MADRRQAFARALVMAPFILGGIVGTGLVGPVRTSIEAEFGLSHTAFGAGLAVVQMLAALTLVASSERLRKHHDLLILRVALAIQALGFAVVFMSGSVAGLLVGWTCILLGGAASPVCNNIAMALWPQNPRRGLTLLHAYNALGKVSGPLIVAACLAIGWRYSFLSVAGITMAIFVMFSLAGRHTFPDRHSLEAAEDPADEAGWRPAHWFALLLFALISGGELAFTTLVPAYFEKVQGLSAQTAGLMLTVHLCGLAAGRFFFGFLGGRFSNNAIIAICLAGGIFSLPAILATGWTWRVIGLFLVGVTFSSTWPTYYAQIAALFRRNTHLLAYGSGLTSHAGISLFVLLSSAIADRSLTLAMFVGPVIMALFGLLYFLTRLSRPATARADATKALRH